MEFFSPVIFGDDYFKYLRVQSQLVCVKNGECLTQYG